MTDLLQKTFLASGGDFSPELMARGMLLFKEHYEKNCTNHTRWYPGVFETLKTLSKNYPLAVLTNKPNLYTGIILRHLKGDGLFHDVITGGDVFPKKPDPSGALHAMKKLKALPGQSLLVGDSLVDAETAKNAGAGLALVYYGFGKRGELDLIEASFRLEKFEELLTLL